MKGIGDTKCPDVSVFGMTVNAATSQQFAAEQMRRQRRICYLVKSCDVA